MHDERPVVCTLVLTALVAAALEDPCCRTNPMPVEAFMVRDILEEVTGHV